MIFQDISIWNEEKPDCSVTARVDFINVLQAPFTRADPKSAKNTVKLSVFIAL